MTILQAIRQGLGKALAVPRMLFLLWLVNLLFAVPASLMIRQVLADSFGSSRVAHNMREGFDRGWYAEFESTAGGFEKTFRPTVSGPGPVLDNLEAWWSGDIVADADPALVALGLGYSVLWAFLLGGVLDRLARPQTPSVPDRFFAAAGRTFPRFFGLALLSGVIYFLIYRLGRQLYSWVEAASRDVTVEKTALVWVVAASAVVVSLLCVVRMIFDYAKIRIVLEDRCNVVEAVWDAMRFVGRRPFATLGVTVGFGIIGAALFGLYLWLAPGAGQSTLTGVVLALLLSQVYLVTRLTVRMALLGGQMSLFRSSGS